MSNCLYMGFKQNGQWHILIFFTKGAAAFVKKSKYATGRFVLGAYHFFLKFMYHAVVSSIQSLH